MGKEDIQIRHSQEGLDEVSDSVSLPQNAENVFLILIQNYVYWKHVYQCIASV